MNIGFPFVVGLAATICCHPHSQAMAGSTTRVSVGSGGAQANGASIGAAISGDARTVVFLSDASNLVAGDSNSSSDFFARDQQLGKTALVGAAPGGTGLYNKNFKQPSISGDGRYVALLTAANLVPSDTGYDDIYVFDRQLGTYKWASIGAGGAKPNGTSYRGVSISADGRYVAFSSIAANLVAGLTPHSRQIYVRDLLTNTTKCASVEPNGSPYSGSSLGFETAISKDGRYVVFTAVGGSLVAGDTNGANDVFVRDMQRGVTVRASLGNGGVQANNSSSINERPGISGNGQFVVFSSTATNLVAADTVGNPDIYVRDLQHGTTVLANLGPGNRPSTGSVGNPAISSNGRFVVFDSNGSDLVADDHNGTSDVFLRDLQLQTTRRVSLTNAGGEANNASYVGSISADGSAIAFYSKASNLVAGDTNNLGDIFVRRP